MNEKLKEKFEQLYKSDEGQEVYKKRKEKLVCVYTQAGSSYLLVISREI